MGMEAQETKFSFVYHEVKQRTKYHPAIICPPQEYSVINLM